MKKPLFVILLAWFAGRAVAAQCAVNGLVVARESRTGACTWWGPDTGCGHD